MSLRPVLVSNSTSIHERVGPVDNSSGVRTLESVTVDSKSACSGVSLSSVAGESAGCVSAAADSSAVGAAAALAGSSSAAAGAAAGSPSVVGDPDSPVAGSACSGSIVWGTVGWVATWMFPFPPSPFSVFHVTSPAISAAAAAMPTTPWRTLRALARASARSAMSATGGGVTGESASLPTASPRAAPSTSSSSGR